MNEKILFVDDDPDIVRLVKETLLDEGFDFVSAEDGKGGIREAQTSHPDLIILDMQLPDIDGFEVCRRLKADKRCKDIPIIMLTGRFKKTSDKVDGLEGGADDYVLKPFEIDELLARIRAVLREYKHFGPKHLVKDHLDELRRKKND
ncbi:response regulator [bacterium]|nr:response regulator [bacterium]NIN91648.1 response regulator [bacterium]NIO17996.1 response regulator [bacterium]NIO72961.1 response regulator [bacterium]